MVGIDQGGLKTEKDDMIFAHQYFIRDQESLLEFIKRKVVESSGLKGGMNIFQSLFKMFGRGC